MEKWKISPYLGYVAEVSFDNETQQYYGEVLNSGTFPIAMFEVEQEEGILDAFQGAVDWYLKGCKEVGIEPTPPAPLDRTIPSGSPEYRSSNESGWKDSVSSSAH